MAARKTTANKEIQENSTAETIAERYKRMQLEKNASSNGSDQEKPQPMLRRSSRLGKRKRDQEDEGKDNEAVEQREDQVAEQDKECTVYLEVVAETSFPAIDHADGEQHSSDVCLACWDQHIESEIQSKSFEGISCLQCPQKLVEEEVRQLAKEKTYAEYVAPWFLLDRLSS